MTAPPHFTASFPPLFLGFGLEFKQYSCLSETPQWHDPKSGHNSSNKVPKMPQNHGNQSNMTFPPIRTLPWA
jgi:hypothetical protein